MLEPENAHSQLSAYILLCKDKCNYMAGAARVAQTPGGLKSSVLLLNYTPMNKIDNFIEPNSPIIDLRLTQNIPNVITLRIE